MKIVTLPINIYGTTVAQSYYDMSTAKYLSGAITYNGSDIISTSMDRAITAWAMPRTIDQKIYDLESISLDPSGYFVTVKNTKLDFEIDNTFVISRGKSLNFYAKVIDVSGYGYKCEIDQPIINYLNSIKSDWMTLTNYKLQVKDPINLLDGIDESSNSIFTTNIYANQYIKVNYGTQEYVAVLDEKLSDNKWYAFVVNIGNTWGQYSVYIWEKHDSDEDVKLQNVFYETMKFEPEYVAVNQYDINRSPSYLTNIRLYTSTIEEERQINELLSYFVKDGDQTIIADNADPVLLAPYITKQR
jgi:hypothetical protein